MIARVAHDALVFALVTAVTVSPFALVYGAFNLLFAWDDRRWRKAWCGYRRANVPRPAVLGNVAPRGARDPGHAADLSAEVSDEVASDE